MEYEHIRSKTRVRLDFLETSGEDLTRFDVGNHLSMLPPHISNYLNIPKAEFVFLLVCDAQEASRFDVLMCDFVSYINRQQPELYGSNFLPVLTKWDTRPSDGASPLEVYRRDMPRTFNLLSTFSPKPIAYSVGSVMEIAGMPTILERSHKSGKGLFDQIIQHFLSHRSKQSDRSNIWKRLITFRK